MVYSVDFWMKVNENRFYVVHCICMEEGYVCVCVCKSLLYI